MLTIFLLFSFLFLVTFFLRHLYTWRFGAARWRAINDYGAQNIALLEAERSGWEKEISFASRCMHRGDYGRTLTALHTFVRPSGCITWMIDRPLSAASHRTMHGLKAVWKFSGWMTSAVPLCVASDGSDWADLILRASCTTCAMELRVSPPELGKPSQPFFFRALRSLPGNKGQNCSRRSRR